MTPEEFIDKWRGTTRTERSAAQEHFLDLCALLGVPTPGEVDRHGAEYTFEKSTRKIGDTQGFAAEEARDAQALLAQGYRGSRYSFGYPACPNLADQKQLLELLRAQEIRVTLSEEDQLDPEQSTSAIVVHHPQANTSRSDPRRPPAGTRPPNSRQTGN